MTYSISLQNQDVVGIGTLSEGFRNHQKWTISLKKDGEEMVFLLIDNFGIKHRCSDFLIEIKEKEFRSRLFACPTLEEKKELIFQWCQACLCHSSPFHVHVETFEGKKIVRFGEYGLKGGGGAEKKFASAGLSVLAVIGGIILITSDSEESQTKLVGGVLISAGIRGGLFALEEKKDGYSCTKFLLQSFYGGVGGLVAGLFGLWAAGADIPRRLFFQVLGNGVSNAATATLSSCVEARKLPLLKEVRDQVISGTLSGTSNFIAIEGIRRWLGTRAGYEPFILGCAGSVASRVITNLLEKKHFTEGLIQAGLVGGIVSGAIGSLEKKKYDQANALFKEQKEKVDRAVAQYKEQKKEIEKQALKPSVDSGFPKTPRETFQELDARSKAISLLGEKLQHPKLNEIISETIPKVNKLISDYHSNPRSIEKFWNSEETNQHLTSVNSYLSLLEKSVEAFFKSCELHQQIQEGLLKMREFHLVCNRSYDKTQKIIISVVGSFKSINDLLTNNLGLDGDSEYRKTCKLLQKQYFVKDEDPTFWVTLKKSFFAGNLESIKCCTDLGVLECLKIYEELIAHEKKGKPHPNNKPEEAIKTGVLADIFSIYYKDKNKVNINVDFYEINMVWDSLCIQHFEFTIDILRDIRKDDDDINKNEKFLHYCKIIQETIQKVKETKRQTELALIDEKEVEEEYHYFLKIGKEKWDQVEEFNVEGLENGVYIFTNDNALGEYMGEVESELLKKDQDQLIAIYQGLKTYKAKIPDMSKVQLQIDIVLQIIFKILHNFQIVRSVQ